MTHMTEENSHKKVFRNEAIYCVQFSEDDITISGDMENRSKGVYEEDEKAVPWQIEQTKQLQV